MSDRPVTYRITLEALEGRAWTAPAIIRLRHLLKSTLRYLGFRCVEAVEVAPDGQEKGLAEEVEQNAR